PAFLVLAGAAVAYRVDASIQRGESAARVRRSIIIRGLSVVAIGYLMSWGYAAMDGHEGLDTLLRADVLHVIGLSIVMLGCGVVGGTQAASRRTFVTSAGVVGVPATLLSPFISDLGSLATGPGRYVLGLWIDVPGVTQ